jgi:TatD DNase family protein
MRLFDAHNHLQDERLAPHLDGILEALPGSGIVRMVVNGSCEEDWPAVAELARREPRVLPSFGYHPWYVHERTPDWQQELVRFLDSVPSAVGEIGLDRWILKNSSGNRACASLAEQEEVFIWQFRRAAERNLPVSIHCLDAWGRLLEILRHEPRPACGFLLHSYGGARELVGELARLGAFFSFPGYFMHERKQRQHDAFLAVPPDRLLIETDAPDQLLPDAANQHPLTDARTGAALNHPANLGAVYEYVATLVGRPAGALAEEVEDGFQRLFGGITTATPG